MNKHHNSLFMRRLIVAATIFSIMVLNVVGINAPALAQGDTAPTVVSVDTADGATNVPVDTRAIASKRRKGDNGGLGQGDEARWKTKSARV